MQEQLPSLHAVNEHFFAEFNMARASEVIFQRFLNAATLWFGRLASAVPGFQTT